MLYDFPARIHYRACTLPDKGFLPHAMHSITAVALLPWYFEQYYTCRLGLPYFLEERRPDWSINRQAEVRGYALDGGLSRPQPLTEKVARPANQRSAGRFWCSSGRPQLGHALLLCLIFSFDDFTYNGSAMR